MEYKYKVKYDKKKNEYRLDYNREDNKSKFRYDLLKEITKEKKIILSLETNLLYKISDYTSFAEKFIFELKKRGYSYFTQSVPNTRGYKLFGIQLNAKSENNALVIVLEINGNDLDFEFFDNYLRHFDLIVGIEPSKTLNEYEEKFKISYSSLFVEEKDFEHYYFDSIVFSMVRTSMNLDNINNLIKG